MLMYPEHLQSWLDYGSSLLIFLIFMLFWLSEMGQIWIFQAFWSCSVDFPHYGDSLTEIGHILGFWGLSGECVGVNVEGGGGIFPTLCVEFCLVYHQTNCPICSKSSDIWKKASDIPHFNMSDNMSDHSEQIIRHFAKSAAMSDGPMAFCECWAYKCMK